jgi:DNA-binding NarL/FixJ family response regulator
MKTALRVLVADDHALMRRGIQSLVESQEGWRVCGEAHRGDEAVAQAEKLKPDIAIVDISMPGLNGLEAAKKIREVSPGTEILILTMHHSDQLILDVLDAGVRGYIVKSDSDRDLVAAVENLARKKPFFSTHATELILNKYNVGQHMSGNPAETARGRLTDREREIVRLLAEGMNGPAIAGILGLKPKTVDSHRANIMRKLRVHTTSELVRYAVRNQIIQA